MQIYRLHLPPINYTPNHSRPPLTRKTPAGRSAPLKRERHLLISNVPCNIPLQAASTFYSTFVSALCNSSKSTYYKYACIGHSNPKSHPKPTDKLPSTCRQLAINLLATCWHSCCTFVRILFAYLPRQNVIPNRQAILPLCFTESPIANELRAGYMNG